MWKVPPESGRGGERFTFPPGPEISTWIVAIEGPGKKAAAIMTVTRIRTSRSANVAIFIVSLLFAPNMIDHHPQ